MRCAGLKKNNPDNTAPPLPFFANRTGARAIRAATLLLCVFLAAASLSGCSTAAVKEDERVERGSPLIWPPPPMPARIGYVRSISTAEDIGAHKGFFRSIFDYLLGSSSEEIVKPYGVTVDSRGRLIVADTASKRVHIFDLDRNRYDAIESPGDARFNSPIGVATDGEDNIYVTDSQEKKVFVFRSNGNFIGEIDGGVKPTGIAINKEAKTLYVVDTGSHNVRVSGLDGKNARTFGGWGFGRGEFNFPVDIFVDRSGEVYVTDTMNYKIQIFDKTGKFIAMFGRQGDGTGDFGRSKGVAVDRDGHIYVADAIFDTVQIFNRQGGFLLNFGSIGSEKGAFWMPGGVYIDGGDRIYVADAYNRRIQIFEYLGDN